MRTSLLTSAFPSAFASNLSAIEPQAVFKPTPLVVEIAAEKSFSQVEDEYWRENHFAQPYGRDGDYEEYEPAYRIGYEGFKILGASGASFADAEEDLRTRYARLAADLPWVQARRASLAAWQRAYEHHVNPNFHSGE